MYHAWQNKRAWQQRCTRARYERSTHGHARNNAVTAQTRAHADEVSGSTGNKMAGMFSFPRRQWVGLYEGVMAPVKCHLCWTVVVSGVDIGRLVSCAGLASTLARCNTFNVTKSRRVPAISTEFCASGEHRILSTQLRASLAPDSELSGKVCMKAVQ